MVTIANYADELGGRVRLAMEAAEVSAARLCELTGIPRSTLTGRLSGAREFSFRELALIADALDVPPSSLTPEDFSISEVA